jgi:hypothetical protein
MAEKTGYTSERVPLTHEEALAAMKAGERLVNGTESYGIAHYHWHEEPILNKAYVLKSDSYYDLHGEGEIIPEDQLPQLYRILTKKKESRNMQ